MDKGKILKPLEIALAARGDKSWLGGAYYVRHLAQSLLALPAEERKTFRLSILVENADQEATFADLAPAVRILDAHRMPPFTVPNRLRWKALCTLDGALDPRLETFLAEAGIDFIFPGLLRKHTSRRVRHAAWIPDFQYKHYPDGSNPTEVRERIQEFSRATSKSPCVVLSSQSAELDCLELFPRSKGKTFVLPFRVEVPTPPFGNGEVLRKYHLPERFFLIANLFAPTKNHKLTFEALELLNQRGCAATLVCTGNLHDYRNPHFVTEIVQEIHRRGVHNQVRLLGVMPRDEQIQLMRHSVAMIQPSLFEGWSTCVEESRCLGKVLLLSDFSVHLEQSPPLARFFEQRNPSALADQMHRVWEEPPAPSTAESEAEARALYKEQVIAAGRRLLQLARTA